MLPLALAEPDQAESIAEELLLRGAGTAEASIAHQALMIVRRDHGDLDQAVAHGNAALRLARRVNAARTADVLASLGLTLVWAGHPVRGRRRLTEAVGSAPREVLAAVLYRRAVAAWKLGDYESVLGDLRQSIKLTQRDGEALWEGRAHVLRGDALTALGRLDEADSELEQAVRVLTSAPTVTGDFEANIAIHNRGNVAFRRGDLVGALNLLDQAADRYHQHHMERPALTIDRVEVLLTAGLVAEARSLVDSQIHSPHLLPLHRAEMLLVSARAAQADAESEKAEQRARQAQVLFSAHGRPDMSYRARLLALRARYTALTERAKLLAPDATIPELDHSELMRISRAAHRLQQDVRAAAAPDLPQLLLLLAQVDRQLDRTASARQALHEAARSRHRASPLQRSVGWLAAAMLAEETSDRRRLLTACRRGLDAVDEYRGTIGDHELRALATGHGLELARLAVENMVVSGDHRGLLWWTERWRGASVGPSAGRPEDRELDQEIAALRDVSRRLEITGESPRLIAERARLESAVRARYRRLRSTGVLSGPPDVRSMLETLGETVLLYIVNVRGTAFAVLVADGRVTRHEIGPSARALSEAAYARFTLRRVAYGRPVDLPRAAERFHAAVLGPVELKAWRGRPVVVVPPASMLSAPFGLLADLADVPFTVSPSLRMWSRARQATRRSRPAGHVALITGPGLTTRQKEVTQLRYVHRTARVLDGEEAVVDRALDVLDGARVGHIAAHGTFRADAPLFSYLQLSDGPLMVHDLDRLKHPPAAMVLSACDSGGVLPIGADEALGLVTGLLSIGTRGVVASVVPVNDIATVAVMHSLHEGLARHSSLAVSLQEARRTAAPNPLLAATAASFAVWGD